MQLFHILQKIWIRLEILGRNDKIFLMVWPLFYSYEYLNINDIEIMMIQLCPIYRTPGLKTPWKVSNIMDAQDPGGYITLRSFYRMSIYM